MHDLGPEIRAAPNKSGETAMFRALLLALALVLSMGVHAKESRVSHLTPESQLIEHGHYVNSSGNLVHSPAHTVSGQAPSGATAQCRDGSYSFSQHRSGTCSHHGGVNNWL
jgi:hypothetical protein